MRTKKGKEIKDGKVMGKDGLYHDIPENYKRGEFDKYNLRNRSDEDRKRISQMGVEARRRNREIRERQMSLQQCMKVLLSLPVSSPQQREVLKKFGFEDDEMINETLLMAALFQKGTRGDVQAISQIVDMMDRLDIYNQDKKITQGVTINLIQTGQQFNPDNLSEQEKKDIFDAENGIIDIEAEEELEEEWGNDIYEG